jgi:hypothetical protein
MLTNLITAAIKNSRPGTTARELYELYIVGPTPLLLLLITTTLTLNSLLGRMKEQCEYIVRLIH